ncbi:uncharacterized protein OCT59_027095 [Rhizophagus irregularis]|uniref:uncharacterized protein n=1 Tax=Rhizophagus irregularis TaxID=588596 RepID=UPI001A028721|nr:hypothetical protein OCT59_027095 [Rhizophagus irregularis]GET65799.1 hypothetical protein GLOIN_2v1768320 [Rhizophagus irregularis DAOM 181602=DAOM 197198]
MLNIIPENLTPVLSFATKIWKEVQFSCLGRSDPFDFYAKQSMTRLKLHLRTWGTVLEWICFSPIELRDKALSKFSEIHRKTTQVIKIGLDNNFRSNLSQFNQLSNNQLISY